MPVDGTDPVDNAFSIINELHQYSPKLADKPRWLVLNKIDLLPEDEVEEICERIAEELGADVVYRISAANKKNTQPLCYDIMTLLESMPKDKFEEEQTDEEVEFKWDTYHREAKKNAQDDDWDDDWDEDDYDVEVIYER
jgi:GTP-binding protein